MWINASENHYDVSECNGLYNISTISIRILCVIFVLDVNECMPNRCENGGNCTDRVNEYNCTCAIGYTGADCETGQHCCKLFCNINVFSY